MLFRTYDTRCGGWCHPWLCVRRGQERVRGAEAEVCVGSEDRGKVVVEVMPNRGARHSDEPQIDFGRTGVLGWRRRE